MRMGAGARDMATVEGHPGLPGARGGRKDPPRSLWREPGRVGPLVCKLSPLVLSGARPEPRPLGPPTNPPVWVRMWPWSSQGREKALPQMAQGQGSVCVRRCILRAPKLLYSLSQCLQEKQRCACSWQCGSRCLASPAGVW